MCKNCDENRRRDVKAAIAKVRISNYRKYFPDLNLDPSEHLLYIEVMLEKLRKEETAEENELRSIEKAIEKYKNDDSEIFNLEAAWNHHGLIYMWHDALRVNMQIAMLAPAIEGLYKRTLRILIKEKLGEKGLNEFFKEYDGNFKGGVKKGIMDALEKLKIESNFPSDIEKCLSALFNYRNALFHNGLEWSKEDCDKFKKDCDKFLDKNQQSNWFTSHSNSCEPYFILPTREFIDKLINFFADSIDSFAKSKRSLSEC